MVSINVAQASNQFEFNLHQIYMKLSACQPCLLVYSCSKIFQESEQDSGKRNNQRGSVLCSSNVALFSLEQA